MLGGETIVRKNGAARGNLTAPLGVYRQTDGTAAMLVTILIVILVIALIGGLPRWGYSANWGYGPSGLLGVVLVVVVLWLLLGGHVLR
jgi:hypothetical protein